MSLARSLLEIRFSSSRRVAPWCAVAALLAPSFAAQVQAWAATLPPNGGAGVDVVHTAGGESYVLAGSACCPSSARLLRYGPSGQLDWSATESTGSAWSLMPARLAVAPNGTLAIGSTRMKPSDESPRALVVAAFSASGALRWEREVPAVAGSFDTTQLRSLGVDAAGRVYAGGMLRWDAPDYVDTTVCAFASDGTPLWTRHVGDDFTHDSGGLIAVVPSGGVLVTGSVDPIYNDAFFWRRTILASYDANGTLLWERRYPDVLSAGTSMTTPVAIERTATGDVLVLAQAATWHMFSGVEYADQQDLRLLKFDAQGALLWERTYGQSPNSREYANDLAIDAAGRATIVGYVGEPGVSPNRALAVQYDADGTLRWTRTWEPPFGQQQSVLTSVEIDALGRSVALGWESWVASPSTLHALLLLRYDTQGELDWMRTYPDPAVPDFWPAALALGPSDEVTLCGGGGFGASYASQLVRYAPSGFQAVGTGSAGTGAAVPALTGSGPAQVGTVATLQIANGVGGAFAALGYGVGIGNYVQLPLLGGILYVLPSVTKTQLLGGASGVAGAGSVSIPLAVPNDASLVGVDLRFQAGVLDAGAASGVALSNALELWIG